MRSVRRFCRAWLATVAVFSSFSWVALAQATEITDDRGVRVVLPQVPQRIVSLFPALTESVCQLGACGRLVGVDRYSNFPASVRTLPRVGGGLDPSIEAIVALKPDLVLMATSTRGADRLAALGLTVVALQPQGHTDVRRTIARIGTLLQVPPQQGVDRIWREIDTAFDVAAQVLPPQVRGVRVYFEVNSGPYAASESSFIGETLTRLGARNIVPASLGPYPRLNPEFVVRADPDLIMVADSRVSEFAQRPGWPALRALRAGRVCAFTQEEADVLVRAGPRLAEGVRLMARCLAEKAVAP